MGSVEGVQSDESSIYASEKEISQHEWDDLVNRCYNVQNKLDYRVGLSTLLKSLGYSRTIRGIKVSNAYFSDVAIKNCHFVDCDLRNTNFSFGKFDHSSFTNCKLSESIFFGAKAKGLSFSNCNMAYTCWNQAELQDFSISGPADGYHRLNETTLEGMSFIGANIKGSATVRNLSLTNVIFGGNVSKFTLTGCSEPLINRPIVAIGIDPTYPATFAKKQIAAIRMFEGLPVFYNHYPIDIDPQSLKEDVAEAFREHEKQTTKLMNRAHCLLWATTINHTIGKIKCLAYEYFRHSDGIILPGGDDVPEILYAKLSPSDINLKIPYSTLKYTDSKELMRSIMEFALLKFCEDNNKPALGICRGCQIMNVFLGGTLRNVRDDKQAPLEIQPSPSGQNALETSTPAMSFLKKIHSQEELYAFSAHDQAISRLGRTVSPLICVKNVIKLATAHKGVFILSQAHPEILVHKDIAEEVILKTKSQYILAKELVQCLKNRLNEEADVDLTKQKLCEILFSPKSNLLEAYRIDAPGATVVDKYNLDRMKDDFFEAVLKQENQRVILSFLESEIKRYEISEKKLQEMMNYSKSVFELFFDSIALSILKLEESVA